MNYQQFLKTTLEETSKIADEKFGKVVGVTKGDDNNQVLTEADIAIGSFILQQIKKYYPTYNLIDEEAGVIDNKSEYTWVVDPIDGTSNFASGVPTYGIMMGLLQGTTPIAGGFALPFTREICIAEKGKGAYLNGDKLSVTSETHLSNCLVAYHIDGHPEDQNRAKQETNIFGEIIKGIRNMRSSGCEPWDGLLVANGKYGALVNQSMKIWDIVAMHSILTESGAIVTAFDGQQIDYKHPLEKARQDFTLCAASPVLHKQLQTIIHSH